MLLGGLHFPQEYLKKITSAKKGGKQNALWGKTRSNYQFEYATFLPKKFLHQGLLPMKRHRKIVNANLKHKRASRSPTLLYASTPSPNS